MKIASKSLIFDYKNIEKVLSYYKFASFLGRSCNLFVIVCCVGESVGGVAMEFLECVVGVEIITKLQQLQKVERGIFDQREYAAVVTL